MRTGMMLAVGERMDRAGFRGMELMSSSHIKKCVRELHEDPWERIRLVAGCIRETPLRVIIGGRNGFELTPESIQRIFLERMAANGVRQGRISDEWNDIAGWRKTLRIATEAGLEPILNIIYSVVSQAHRRLLRGAGAAGGHAAGRADLLQGPRRPADTRPHPRAGAAHQGEHRRHSAGVPHPLHHRPGATVRPGGHQAGNPHHQHRAARRWPTGRRTPSLFNVAANARSLGYETAVDEEVLRPVSEYFTRVARREGLPIGAPVEYDYSQYLHQVPGGMISNLRHQLARVGLGDHMERALEEVVRVREELGYPIMVTPLSQFVGSQAAINIIVGERYKEVTDQVILYALGRWGREGSDSMDPGVKDRILGCPAGPGAGRVGAAGTHDPGVARQVRRRRSLGRGAVAAVFPDPGGDRHHARRGTATGLPLRRGAGDADGGGLHAACGLRPHTGPQRGVRPQPVEES